MRHGKKFNHLGRTSEHRKALLANMANSLITHKRIKTTLAKAKALRCFVEPLVTRAKDNSTHSRRIVFSHLQNKEAVTELFSTVAEKVGDRPGGYVRVIRMGFRKGDAADMAMIELVDFNPEYSGKPTSEETGAQRKRTRRRGASKSGAAATTVAAAATTVAAAAAIEEAEVEEEAVEEVAGEDVVDTISDEEE